MKLKIYQAYYDAAQKEQLDNEFTPLDNTANPTPELVEYAINLKTQEMALAQGLDMWGTFSWRWKEKIRLLSAQDVVTRIENNPGYDVYFFNGYYDQTVLAYNVWEQGQWHHKNMLQICEYLFPKLGIDVTIMFQPMSEDHMVFACYCVATKEFWAGFMDLTKRYYDEIEKFPAEIKALHDDNAAYPNGLSFGYFPFIHERLFSTYLFLNQHKFKVLPYHDGKAQFSVEAGLDKLSTLKETALINQDTNLLDQWRQLRNQFTQNFTLHKKYVVDLAQYFIPFYKKS